MEGWDNEACEGEAVVRIGVESEGRCVKSERLVRAVRIVPAFNGDSY